MTTIDRQLTFAVKNLSGLQTKAVPKASAMAINRIATRAVVHSIKDAAKAVKVKQKVLRPRATINKASAARPVAYVRVRRNELPAISIDTARTQVKRKKGKMQISRSVRGEGGRYVKRELSGNTSIVVGRHKFKDAFIQQLKNGRWHIMQRTSDRRYPIEVCKVPVSNEITTAFERNSSRLMKTDMPKELVSAMQQQVRLVIRRDVARGN
ncbi:phage tail protein [Vibrio ziniensis]|uniref:Phage tail protein n=1 Tax=Vibrio ziniensis TaxID=2711221 RepID=A0A6G7CHA6_9VIBR|nr:phage tail protein [Vibrio ziniensis]QIH41453.1 phage tail protein [Vibrio ziniensis]